MLPLDHLVLATGDLDATSAWFADCTGVMPTPGGSHVGLGTRNELVALSDTTYLEIIGPDEDQDDPAGPRPFGIDNREEASLVTWAVKATDLAGHVERCAAAGLDLGTPLHMSRAKPDGSLLEWSLTVGPSAGPVQPVPFLIDWKGSPSPALTSASGVTLTDFAATHPDPPALQQQLETLGVDLRVEPGTSASLTATLHCPRGSLEII